MKNSHISRNRQLNIPITVKNEVGMINTVADRVAADEAHATAHKNTESWSLSLLELLPSPISWNHE